MRMVEGSGTDANVAGAKGNQSEVEQSSGFFDRDESATPAKIKNARERLWELRRENSKLRALVNANLQDIEEAARDR